MTGRLFLRAMKALIRVTLSDSFRIRPRTEVSNLLTVQPAAKIQCPEPRADRDDHDMGTTWHRHRPLARAVVPPSRVLSALAHTEAAHITLSECCGVLNTSLGGGRSFFSTAVATVALPHTTGIMTMPACSVHAPPGPGGPVRPARATAHRSRGSIRRVAADARS